MELTEAVLSYMGLPLQLYVYLFSLNFFSE